MKLTDLTLQQTIEISRLYTEYSNSDLQSAIYQAIAYDWVNTGDEYFSITGYQLLTEKCDTGKVRRLITKRARRFYQKPTEQINISLKDIYGADTVLIPEGYKAIGLGLISPNQPYLGLYSRDVLLGDSIATGVIRLLLKKI